MSTLPTEPNPAPVPGRHARRDPDVVADPTLRLVEDVFDHSPIARRPQGPPPLLSSNVTSRPSPARAGAKSRHEPIGRRRGNTPTAATPTTKTTTTVVTTQPGKRRLVVVSDPVVDRTSSHVPSRTPSAAVPATPAPRRVALRRRTGGRIAGGSILLSCGVVGVVVVTFLAMGAVFPWLAIFDSSNDQPLASVDHPVAEVRTVADPGPSPAENVVDAVMSTSLPVFTGWDEAKQTNTIGALSLGFGCDPKDGLSPAVATTRGWVTADGTESVTLSARAYSAGAGAVAIDGLNAAALACDDAWVETPAVSGLGVESTQITSEHAATLTWRRGDVLMVAQVTSNGSAGNPGAYAEALHRLDDVLDDALTTTCLDQGSESDDSTRSPYINRSAYTGQHVTEDVLRPAPTRPSAEERIGSDPDLSTVLDDPVIASGTAPSAVTPVGDLPAVPNPLPTAGPLSLPVPVAYPVVPSRPAEPADTRQVTRSVADTTGPGCGWAFTGQAAPQFDATAAEAAYAKKVTAAQEVLGRAWSRWQNAKVAFYAAYADYLVAASRYDTYAAEVARVRAAWQVIAYARAAFYTEHANWQAAVDARNAWLADRAAARADYLADQQECRHQTQNPPPSVPTAAPTTAPTPTSTPTVAPTSGPTSGPGTTLVCPPVRPSILDEPTPTVPVSPTPRPEAQLP